MGKKAIFAGSRDQLISYSAELWRGQGTDRSSNPRRKADPFRSARSMLTFYINRAGRQLPGAQRARLEAAKDEPRALFGKPQANG
jgi:hypothetical protein